VKPDYIHVCIKLGIALAEKGLWDEAISQFQRVIQLNPNDSFARNNLGIALRQKGDTTRRSLSSKKFSAWNRATLRTAEPEHYSGHERPVNSYAK